MTKRKASLITLVSTFIVCVILAVATAFNGNAKLTVNAGGSGLRYDDTRVEGEKLNTYYQDHWKTGQGTQGAGDEGGKWYIGYGDVNANKYEFTQMTKTADAENDSLYQSDTPHQMSFGINITTTLYSETGTQTMYVWQATEPGLVKFDGFVAKTSDNVESAVGTALGLSSTAWLPGIDWNATEFDWIENQSYTISVYKVEKNGAITQIGSDATYTQGYAHAFSNDAYRVVEGDKIVFGLKCNSLGSQTSSWFTNHLILLSSQFEKRLQPAYSFGNGMVLQRNKPVNVYGYGVDAGRTVTVTFNGQTKNASADTNGDWCVVLDSMSANANGQNLVITDGIDTITYTDVKVGEVWYCGGQSNMEYTLGAILIHRGISENEVWGGQVDYANSILRDYTQYSNWDKISVYSVWPNQTDSVEKYGTQNKWQKGEWATANNANDLHSFIGFSAYAVGFALKLQENLGVPVGVITSSWGGSSVDKWVSQEGATNNSLESITNDRPHSMYNGMTYPLNKHTVNGLLWYQGCAESWDGAYYKWQSWMRVLIEEFRTNHGANAPVIAQLMVEHGEPDADWKKIRNEILSLMNGDNPVSNYYAVNGIGFGGPYEEVLAKGNYIHPSDKCGLSANAADIATTNVYSVTGYNDVAEYPIAVYKTSDSTVIEYAQGVSLKLSEGTTVNNLEMYDGATWSTVTNATVSGNKVTFSGTTATKIRYACYNLMGPDGTKLDTGRYSDHYISGTYHEFRPTYNSEQLVNLYSQKTNCPDLAVFPILEYTVGSTPPTQTTTYKATVTNNSAQGSVTGIINNNYYEENSNVTITIRANTGYRIATIMLNGRNVTVTNDGVMNIPHTVTSEGLTLEVTYDVESDGQTYQVSIKYNRRGTVTGIEDGRYASGYKFTSVKIKANTGYLVNKVTWAGQEISIEQGSEVTIAELAVKGNSELVIEYIKSGAVNNKTNDAVDSDDPIKDNDATIKAEPSETGGCGGNISSTYLCGAVALILAGIVLVVRKSKKVNE